MASGPPTNEMAGGAGGSGGYHYFHDKIGDGAPPPEHKPIDVSAALAEETALTLTNYAFMDDEDKVKIYVTLTGDLEGVVQEGVELKVEKAPFDPTCSMMLHLRGKKSLHRLYVSHLLHEVVPEKCKVKVNATKGKLIVTLIKKDNVFWEELRSKVSLPWRRGGGGGPSGGGMPGM